MKSPIANQYKISLFADGFIIGEKRELSTACKDRNLDNLAKRGQIVNFSSKSARRLREFLLTQKVGNEEYKRIAITYTLPVNVSVESWYSIIKRWRQNLTRFELSAVWRVELQKRGVPHLHVVGYVRTFVDCGAYWLSWVRAVDSVEEDSGLPITSHDGFLIYGCVMRYVEGSRWYAYLAAHTVKHKNDQLGWRGRQWGVVNRALFHFCEPFNVSMSPWVATRIARVIRRRYHYKGYTKESFGTRAFFGLQNLGDLIDYFRSNENESTFNL